MKARHKDTGEIIQLAEQGIISSDGRCFCWYQVELIPEPIDEVHPDMDFEKEYTEFVVSDPVYSKLVNGIVGKAIAHHFYELGLNTRKEE